MGQDIIFSGNAKLIVNGVEIGTVSMLTAKSASSKEAKQDAKAK